MWTVIKAKFIFLIALKTSISFTIIRFYVFQEIFTHIVNVRLLFINIIKLVEEYPLNHLARNQDFVNQNTSHNLFHQTYRIVHRTHHI